MAGLPRELLKWLQSLDLTWQIKMPKWDLTNGFLIAEIFSWYFPQEIQIHSYNNGTSLESKLSNWTLLRNFIRRHKMEIPEEYIEGTIHSKEGAANLLIEKIYELLTNRPVKKLQKTTDVDFTDWAYQLRLPVHARSTASQAIKNNIRATEAIMDQCILVNQQKSQRIINSHILHRVLERSDNPARFDIRPSLGELCPRQSPQQQLQERDSMESTMIATPTKVPTKSFVKPKKENTKTTPPPLYYREIKVNQSEAPKPMTHTHPVSTKC